MDPRPVPPTFSVVIATYNRAATLPAAMTSVLAQTFRDFELVIVDDGSSDDTARVVAEFGDPRVRYVHRENGGLGAARNSGVSSAGGTWVTFLDDDDLVRPEWLERFAGALRDAGDDCVVACCGEVLVEEDGRVVGTRLPGPLGPGFADYEGWFLAGTFAVRRDVYGAVGGFTPGLPHMHQTEFALRLLPYCRSRSWTVATIPEPLLEHHVGGPRRTGLDNTGRFLEAMEYVFGHHGEQLARSSWLYAKYSAVAGVAAARIGDYRRARKYLWRAARTQPRDLRAWARVALASFPPIGRRVWDRHGVEDPADRAA